MCTYDLILVLITNYIVNTNIHPIIEIKKLSLQDLWPKKEPGLPLGLVLALLHCPLWEARGSPAWENPLC